MNGDRDVLLGIGQVEPFYRTAVGRERASVSIAHSWNKYRVCCSCVTDRLESSLSTDEPVRQSNADVSELFTGFLMRVWFVDQVERDSLIGSGDRISGGREFAPKIRKIS